MVDAENESEAIQMIRKRIPRATEIVPNKKQTLTVPLARVAN